MKISKKSPFLLIKKALLPIAESELGKILLIVRGDCFSVTQLPSCIGWTHSKGSNCYTCILLLFSSLLFSSNFMLIFQKRLFLGLLSRNFILRSSHFCEKRPLIFVMKSAIIYKVEWQKCVSPNRAYALFFCLRRYI